MSFDSPRRTTGMPLIRHATIACTSEGWCQPRMTATSGFSRRSTAPMLPTSRVGDPSGFAKLSAALEAARQELAASEEEWLELEERREALAR